MSSAMSSATRSRWVRFAACSSICTPYWVSSVSFSGLSGSRAWSRALTKASGSFVLDFLLEVKVYGFKSGF